MGGTNVKTIRMKRNENSVDSFIVVRKNAKKEKKILIYHHHRTNTYLSVFCRQSMIRRSSGDSFLCLSFMESIDHRNRVFIRLNERTETDPWIKLSSVEERILVVVQGSDNSPHSSDHQRHYS